MAEFVIASFRTHEGPTNGRTPVSDANPMPVRLKGSAGTKNAPVQVTVTTAATQILAANPNRAGAIIANTGASTLFIGRDNTVTTGNGIPVAAGGSIEDNQSGDAWFGIVASGTADVRALEVQ